MTSLAFDNKLFLAPLENPQKVLDLGTGTGIWAMCADCSSIRSACSNKMFQIATSLTSSRLPK